MGRVPTRSAQLVNGEEGAQTSEGTGRSDYGSQTKRVTRIFNNLGRLHWTEVDTLRGEVGRNGRNFRPMERTVLT